MKTQTTSGDPTDELKKLRDDLSRLRESEREHENTREAIREMEHRLAYLTAIGFVAIDDGKSVEVYGAASERRTQVRGMSIAVERAKLICFKIQLFALSGEGYTFYLRPGGQLNFTITDETGDHGATYLAHGFITADEAEAWAANRRKDFGATH
ncbi:hypothetical protein KBA73_02335 [Patescibacteria group bacterium]|nr:hypothetical protein [Patescibacteria group bacterium]